MITITNRFGWEKTGLRLRYRPGSGLCSGLVQAAPWLNVAMLFVFFMALSSRVVLEPGIAMALPRAQPGMGTEPGVTAVVISREDIGRRERQETVFFDDSPFLVADPAQMKALALRLRDIATARRGAPLVVEADRHVTYGTMSLLCAMARTAGFPVVNLVQDRPLEEAK